MLTMTMINSYKKTERLVAKEILYDKDYQVGTQQDLDGDIGSADNGLMQFRSCTK